MISISTTSNQKQTLRRQKVLEISTIAEELCTIQFSKPEISISVMELKCTEPGCPPLETAFAVMEKDIDCKFKVLKELIQVTRNDIVDAIQAWARGDAPPCGCEFTIPGLTPDTTPATTTTTTVDQQSQEEMERFMQQMNDGVL